MLYLLCLGTNRKKKEIAAQRNANIEALFDEEFIPDGNAIDLEDMEERFVQPLPTLLNTPESLTNRERRRNLMSESLKLEYDFGNRFIPDSNDKELERLHISIACMTRKNKSYVTAQNEISEASLAEMREGRLPTNKADRRYVPGTYKYYSYGARKMMGVLCQYHNKELHYKNFFDFGQDTLIRPKNIVHLLNDNLSTGNEKTFAFEAYKLLLEAQMEQASLHEEMFKTEVCVC